jgi:hypothetical protein
MQMIPMSLALQLSKTGKLQVEQVQEYLLLMLRQEKFLLQILPVLIFQMPATLLVLR